MSPRRATLIVQITMALGLSLLSSCSTTNPNKTSNTLSPDVPPLFRQSTVLVFDPIIAEKLTVDSQTVEDIDGLYVTHTVFNPSLVSDPMRLKAQTFFKNDNGQTVDVSPVREIDILPKQPYIYIAHSARTDISKFVVYLRSADEAPQPAAAPAQTSASSSTPTQTAPPLPNQPPQVNLQNLH